MRSRFDEQLALLNNELITMGALCEEAIALAAKSLSKCDERFAEKISALDNEIDQKERDIESLCLKLLLQQQPVARDLRQISAALKMITDMERIGDQAEDIVEITTFLNGHVPPETLPIYKMEQATIKMVTDSVDAYVNKDLDLAKAVIDYDDIVDNCFNEMKSDLIRTISENPKDGEYALDLLMISKYFERIGDHAVNIAEWVQFSILGCHPDSLKVDK